MKTSTFLHRGIAWCLLAFACCLAVHRARVQPIAHDEALEYEWFLEQGVYHLLAFNAGNHVLFTILAKPFVSVLGVTEFSLRAPSLIGTVAYLIATYLLCRRLFGDGILFLISVAMLSLNPQILELMPAARGYALGLAFLSGAMYIFAGMSGRGDFNPDDKEWRRGCATASVFLALSVTAHLTNLVPAMCLALIFSIIVLGEFPALMKCGDRRLRVFAQHLIVPGFLVGFSILWPYLIQARLGQAKIYLDNASDSLRDVFNASFLYKWTEDVHSNLSAVPLAAGSWQERVSDLGVYLFLPLLFCFVAFGLILLFCSPNISRMSQNAHCKIFGGTAVACIVFIVVLHIVAKIDYPLSRYCVFLVPLFTISSLLIAHEVYFRLPRYFLKNAGLLIAAVVVSDYVLSLNMTGFRYNAYDTVSRELFLSISSDARSRGLTSVRLGGTWWYEPEINFYRRRYHTDWIMPYDIKDRSSSWQTPNSLAPADYDYFVFTPANDPGLEISRVRIIFQDATRHVTVIAIHK
jgi:hypothetical protein